MTKQFELNVLPAKTYFNTTKIYGKTLAAEVQTANRQEQAILDYLVPLGSPAGATQIHSALRYNGHFWPLTSVRRALTCLKDKNLVARLQTRTIGSYGKLEYEWRAL